MNECSLKHSFMSSFFNDLQGRIPDPSTRLPLTKDTFTWIILPPILSFSVTSVLVVLPRTLPIRLALWPITIYLTFRASISIDVIEGILPNDDRFTYLNQVFVLGMAIMGMLSSIWTFQSKPYHRASKTGNPLLDAFDLVTNLRGIGWSWSTGLKIPKETRDTSSLPSFLLSTFYSLLIHLVLGDSFLLSVQSFNGMTNSPNATIFDPSLPPIQRYLRSCLITFLTGLGVYHSIALYYTAATMVSLIFLPKGPRNNPSQWPPLFDAPWLCTSVSEFWSTRWHQLFRNIFVKFGGTLFYVLFGRVGGVFGAFLTSGILHSVGLWGMGKGTDFVRVTGFFLMMAAGIILEFLFERFTNKKVGGIVGWLWSVSWIIGWGNLLVEAWLTKGLPSSVFLPDDWRPSLRLLTIAKAMLP